MYRPHPGILAGGCAQFRWRGYAVDRRDDGFWVGTCLAVYLVCCFSGLDEIPAKIRRMVEHGQGGARFSRTCTCPQIPIQCRPGKTLGNSQDRTFPDLMDPDIYGNGRLPIWKNKISAWWHGKKTTSRTNWSGFTFYHFCGLPGQWISLQCADEYFYTVKITQRIGASRWIQLDIPQWLPAKSELL